eukprot:Amastigsp_a511069_32.p3 type:complete len:179 gc:universal Amastigsp_a511069_32:819-283(-)
MEKPAESTACVAPTSPSSITASMSVRQWKAPPATRTSSPTESVARTIDCTWIAGWQLMLVPTSLTLALSLFVKACVQSMCEDAYVAMNGPRTLEFTRTKNLYRPSPRQARAASSPSACEPKSKHLFSRSTTRTRSERNRARSAATSTVCFPESTSTKSARSSKRSLMATRRKYSKFDL